jgi:hypothetical protein
MSTRLLFVFRNNSYNADIDVKAESLLSPKSRARGQLRQARRLAGSSRAEIAAVEPVIAGRGK